MMRRIVGASLKFRLVVAALATLLLVFGFTQLEPFPVDVLPEFSRPSVEIQTEALGLSAEEVEAMITTPLEATMLNGTPWAEEIRSTSIPSLSSIVLIFERGTDIMLARQVVQERLTHVTALPKVAKTPVMINPVSSASRFMTIGLTSDTLSLIEMSVLARWTILPRLMGLSGVANVSIWGERKWQLQVQVNPERLRNQNVTLRQVISTAGNALWTSPLSYLQASTPGTGGWIENANQRIGIQHILPIQNAEDLGQVMVEGAPTKRLSDVATVVENHQPLIGDSLVNDAPGLTLVVEKYPWTDTTDTTEEVEAALTALRPGLAGMKMDPTLFRQANYLELAEDNISAAFLMGALLLMGALFALLLNWRAALISTTAIVVSVIAAGTVLYLRGVTTNLIIIAGLMLALAIVIDDAIGDIEHIVRRLRQARGGKPAAVILEAVVERRSPPLYAIVILILAVMPLMVLEGVSGSLLQPLVTSYILAVLASMVVAMTVTPALSQLLVRNTSLPIGESPAIRLLRGVHRALFAWAARAPVPVLVGVGVVALVSLAAVPSLREESLLPDLKETDLVVHLEASPGTSHPAMSRLAAAASRDLRALPGVRNVSAHLGRALTSDKRSNINVGELWVSLDPSADHDAAVASVKEAMAGHSSLSPEVRTYLQTRLREESSGARDSLVVRVYGENIKVIRAKAEQIQQGLARVSGLAEATVRYPKEMPIVEIEVDIDRAKLHGLTPGDVRRASTSLVSGIEVGSLFEEQKVFDVVVWSTPETRDSLVSVQQLLIDTPSGGHVRLQDVAHIRVVPAATEIRRDAAARVMDVTVHAPARDLAAVAGNVERVIQQVEFPLGYRAELLGDYARRKAAGRQVLGFAIAAVVGILLLLQAYFRNWMLATVVLLTLPASLAGGVVAAVLSGGGLLSFGSVVGFLAVLGIAVRNALTLVGSYRHLENQGFDVFGATLIERGTEEQAAPMLMSAIAIAVVFLPIALFGSVAGLEIAQPIAIVVLGGLVTTTLVSLAGVPAMSLLCGGAPPELDLERVAEVPAATVAV